MSSVVELNGHSILLTSLVFENNFRVRYFLFKSAKLRSAMKDEPMQILLAMQMLCDLLVIALNECCASYT